MADRDERPVERAGWPEQRAAAVPRPLARTDPDTPVLVFRSATGRTGVARRAEGFSIHVLHGKDRLGAEEAQQLARAILPTAEPQQADASTLGLIKQYGNAKEMRGWDAGRGNGHQQHDKEADALYARIAALLPQQPIQARSRNGPLWWIHECGAVTTCMEQPEPSCSAGDSGPWRPLLVGGDPVPEGAGCVVGPDGVTCVVADRPHRDQQHSGSTLGDVTTTLLGGGDPTPTSDVVAYLNREAERITDELLKTREQRDEARAEVERLTDERDLARKSRDEHRNRLEAIAGWMHRDGHAVVRPTIGAVTGVVHALSMKAATPAQTDPLVLSLPEVPEGAVSMLGLRTQTRYWPDGDTYGVEVNGLIHTEEAFSLADVLDREDPHGVRVEMAPPREPRTWPKLDAAPADIARAIQVEGFGRFVIAVRRTAPENHTTFIHEDDEETGGLTWTLARLRELGEVTEVFDEPGGER